MLATSVAQPGIDPCRRCSQSFGLLCHRNLARIGPHGCTLEPNMAKAGTAPRLTHLSRRKTSDALVPPKPNEFDSTTSIFRFLAWCGTRSIGGLDRRIVQIDRRRRDPVAHGEDREDRLDRAGRAEQMPDRGLGRRHADVRGGIADQPLHGAELDLVAERRRGAVRVDVVDLRRRDAGALRSRPSCSATRRRRPPPAR